TLRRSTVGDEEDAMQQAVQLKRGKNPVTVEVCLFSKVTRLPYDAIRSLYGADYAAIREAFKDLNGYTPRDEGDADSDPTTPETA
ncbi:MAG: phage tail assembly protein, partial [Desulfovibrio sp.]|nr:phage tail assembly protein [Desulfovibrio sp.]